VGREEVGRAAVGKEGGATSMGAGRPRLRKKGSRCGRRCHYERRRAGRAAPPRGEEVRFGR
jgi:hypothetical protein